jgi:hypothetical protein
LLLLGLGAGLALMMAPRPDSADGLDLAGLQRLIGDGLLNANGEVQAPDGKGSEQLSGLLKQLGEVGDRRGRQTASASGRTIRRRHRQHDFEEGIGDERLERRAPEGARPEKDDPHRSRLAGHAVTPPKRPARVLEWPDGSRGGRASASGR